MSRVHRMGTPEEGSEMLNMFKQEFLKWNEFTIVPGFTKEDSFCEETLLPLTAFGLRKRNITFKDISEVSESDIDAPVLKTPYD